MAQVKILPSRNNSSNTAAHSPPLTLTLLHQNRNGKKSLDPAAVRHLVVRFGNVCGCRLAHDEDRVGWPGAKTEMRRMVAEKIEAALSLNRWLSPAVWEQVRKVRPKQRSAITAAGCGRTGGGWLDVQRVLMIRTAGWQLDLD